MSAPPVNPTVSTSASGYEDGFGRRVLAFDREDGSMRERLYLRPEFSIYQHALRDAFAGLTATADSRLVAPRAIERDNVTGELVAISDFAGGERLADLLEAASEHARDEGAVPGIEVALGFLLEVLPALDALGSTTGLPHGALAPSRCVLASDGRVILTECGFAAILQRLNLNRQRLWREFRIAVPPVAGAARFDPTGDVAQAALAAVMLVLGRPMQEADDPADTLPDLLAEVIEIAQIRSNVSFAINLQRFLQRALPLPGRRPYQTVDAALQDVRQLASGFGVQLCKASLVDFVHGTIGTSASAFADDAEHVDVPVVRLETMPLERAPSLEIVPEPYVEEPEILLAPLVEPYVEASEIVVAPLVEPYVEEPEIVPAPLVEPHAEEPPAPPIELVAAAEFADVPVETWPTPPRAIEEPQAALVDEFRSSFTDEPQARFDTPEVATFDDRVPAVEEPAPQVHHAPPARRRRSRSKREDALRSSVTPAAPKTPPPTPLAEPAPAPEPLISTPVLLQPVVAPPSMVVPQPVFAQHAPAPLPVFAPVPIAAGEQLWEPPKSLAPPPVAIAPRPVAPAPVAAAPLRLKNDPAIGSRAPRYDPRDFAGGYIPPGAAAAATAGGRRVPWKFAVAAAAVMITVIAAGRVYLPDTDTLKAAAKGGTAPVTVTAPPPVTTGTIVVQTQPAGARVLLDGSPAGETPLRIVDVAPGKHVLTFVTSSATVKRTIKVEANKTLTLDVPVFSGWVAIFAPILLEVSEEGRALGTTEDGRLMLPPGRHTLTLTNRAFGYSASHAVDIEAGEVRSLNIQPTGTVNLNAVPWAEVWIDGKKAGETPLANLQLPLGNREIIFKHPEFGERRMMTAVTAGAPAAISVDFSK